MSDPLDRLASTLADRYRIERGLGQGGMATVYLAQDLKDDRQVAIKVLKPELAAVLGADRFVQEIKTTAALQHPPILPLFDSGSADGFLYYVIVLSALTAGMMSCGGAAYCWGAGVAGQLGDGIAAERSTAVLVAAGSPSSR